MWPPCKTLAPILEQLSDEYEGKVDIYKIGYRSRARVSGGIWALEVFLRCYFVRWKGQPEMANGALPKAELERIMADVLKITK